jgi:nicotinate phosphoribosyltransferase
MVLAADGVPVVDFGMRRMHGLEAAWRGVRAYRVAGIAGTSNVLGGLSFDVPVRGTMAHSYVQSHDDETDALRRYARDYPGTTLLVDTYDTLRGVDRVIALVRDEGLDVGAVRIDSGDLGELAGQARRKLDAAGLDRVRIVVSGGLDEEKIQALVRAGAPIDGFGVGTEMGSVADAPSLDFAYKLTEYQGRPRLKTSPGKPLYPGARCGASVTATALANTTRSPAATRPVTGYRCCGRWWKTARRWRRHRTRIRPASGCGIS